METLILKNYQLDSLIKVVGYPMPFVKGRIKNRFMTPIIEKAREVEKNRLEIINTLCEKDKDGKPLIEGNAFKLSDENKEKWQKEYEKMMKEDCIIDVTPSFKLDLGPIKDIINQSPVILDDQQTIVMEEIMTAIELIKPKTKK